MFGRAALQTGLRARALVIVLAAAMAPVCVAGPVWSQSSGNPLMSELGVPRSGILTLESERMFEGSAFGRRVANEIEAESAVLAAENRRIEAELAAEEQDLTARRAEMDAEAFSALADAFDEKVQMNRRQQDAKARDLGQRTDAARVEFLRAVRPVLETLMNETGASVVLERSSVFLSSNASDITDLAIERIDAAIGDGRRPEGDSEN